MINCQPDDAPWFVAQLKPNCVQIARRNLERQNFTCFLPLERYGRRYSRRIVESTRPFFGGYIFVGASELCSTPAAIQSTRGVSQLVKFGDRPALIRPEIIKGLYNACDENECISSCDELPADTAVEITQGAFSSLVGRVSRSAPADRVWVLLEIMGTQSRTLLDRAHIRAKVEAG